MRTACCVCGRWFVSKFDFPFFFLNGPWSYTTQRDQYENKQHMLLLEGRSQVMRRTVCNGILLLQISPCAHKVPILSFQLCMDASPYDFMPSTCRMVDFRFRKNFDRNHSSSDQCTPKQQSTARSRWSWSRQMEREGTAERASHCCRVRRHWLSRTTKQTLRPRNRWSRSR